MKKILIALLVLFVLGIGAIFFGASWVVSNGLKETVNTFGPEFTKTDLSVQDVQVSLLGGSSKISGLLMGNPEGFKGEKAMSVDHLEVAVYLGTVFDEGEIGSAVSGSGETLIKGGTDGIKNVTGGIKNLFGGGE